MRKRHLLLFGASAAIFAALAYIVGVDELFEGLSRIQPSFLPVLAFLVLTEFTLEVLRIQVYFHRLGIRKPFREVFYAYYLGLPIAFTTPSRPLGELGRAFVFKKKLAITTNEALTATAAERLIDVAFLVACALGGLLVLAGGGAALPRDELVLGGVVFLGILAAFLAFLCSKRLQSCVLGGVCLLEGCVGVSASPVIQQYLDSFRRVVVAKKILALSLFYNAALWGADFLRVWLVFRMLAVDVDYLAVAAIMSATYILGIISQLPGGLGAFEASGAALFVLIGVAPELAAAAMLVERLLSYWSYILIGWTLLAREGLDLGVERLDALKRTSGAP